MSPEPCVSRETFDQMKAAATPALVHELLGCTWGHTIGLPEDRDPCQEPAAQIIALHPNGGDAEVHVKLCAYHITRVLLLTEPHKEDA